ncbi:MAG: YjfK family protein [Epibacterium sp.]|nr:YjfK family protein [Epibacterium sp.]NQX74428.1 DUF2491 family protein [Epibacterium sp.]
MFRSWFKRPQTPATPEVLGLTIGRAIRLDTMEFRLLPHDSLFVGPETDMMVTAQGACDLGEQSFLHRFYPDDDRFLLQVQGGDGHEDPRVDELMLWFFHDVQYPAGETAWKDHLTRLRQPRFALHTETGTVEFERAWFNDSPIAQDPVTYWEEVRDSREQSEPTRIFQSAMLFARTATDGRDDMLLVNMEEPEHGERAVSFMIGRSLPQHSLIT